MSQSAAWKTWRRGGVAALSWIATILAVVPSIRAQGAPNVDKIEYKGWKNALRISNGEAEIIATLDVGPRIVSYRLKDGANVFKEYSDQFGKSGEDSWQIRGGHRLWIAPEDLKRTYATDNGPISYEIETDGSVRFVQPPDSAGIQKTMSVKLSRSGSSVEVLHTIKNAGSAATTVAPWALTVMSGGGVEVIPLPPHAAHPGGSADAANASDFLPNTTLVLWPYFEFTDPRWTFGKDYILLRHMHRGPTKIGLSNSPGWAAYLNDGMLFIKHFDWNPGATYPDRGVNYETFSNEDMVEMESLGPLVTLPPGEAVQHRERWELFREAGALSSESDAARVMKAIAR